MVRCNLRHTMHFESPLQLTVGDFIGHLLFGTHDHRTSITRHIIQSWLNKPQIIRAKTNILHEKLKKKIPFLSRNNGKSHLSLIPIAFSLNVSFHPVIQFGSLHIFFPFTVPFWKEKQSDCVIHHFGHCWDADGCVVVPEGYSQGALTLG